jgi:hypothetical protein
LVNRSGEPLAAWPPRAGNLPSANQLASLSGEVTFIRPSIRLTCIWFQGLPRRVVWPSSSLGRVSHHNRSVVSSNQRVLQNPVQFNPGQARPI